MLSKEQMQCIALMIEGMKQKQIAGVIKMTEQTIVNWKKNEEFMQEYERQFRDSIRYLAPKARAKMEKLIDANNEHVAFQACKDTLDRAGYKPTDKQEIESHNKNDNTLIVRLEGELEEWSK